LKTAWRQPKSNLLYFAVRAKGETSYLELGENTKAIEDYTKRISLAPNFARYYKLRGDAYHRLGDDQKAAEDYKLADKLAR